MTPNIDVPGNRMFQWNTSSNIKSKLFEQQLKDQRIHHKHVLGWQKSTTSAVSQTGSTPSKQRGRSLESSVWTLPHLLLFVVQLGSMNKGFGVLIGSFLVQLTRPNNRRGNHTRLFSIPGVSNGQRILYSFSELSFDGAPIASLSLFGPATSSSETAIIVSVSEAFVPARSCVFNCFWCFADWSLYGSSDTGTRTVSIPLTWETNITVKHLGKQWHWYNLVCLNCREIYDDLSEPNKVNVTFRVSSSRSYRDFAPVVAFFLDWSKWKIQCMRGHDNSHLKKSLNKYWDHYCLTGTILIIWLYDVRNVKEREKESPHLSELSAEDLLVHLEITWWHFDYPQFAAFQVVHRLRKKTGEQTSQWLKQAFGSEQGSSPVVQCGFGLALLVSLLAEANHKQGDHQRVKKPTQLWRQHHWQYSNVTHTHTHP